MVNQVFVRVSEANFCRYQDLFQLGKVYAGTRLAGEGDGLCQEVTESMQRVSGMAGGVKFKHSHPILGLF